MVIHTPPLHTTNTPASEIAGVSSRMQIDRHRTVRSDLTAQHFPSVALLDREMCCCIIYYEIFAVHGPRGPVEAAVSQAYHAIDSPRPTARKRQQR